MGDVDAKSHLEARRPEERPPPLSYLLASAPHHGEDLGRSTAGALLFHGLLIALIVWLTLNTDAFTPGDQGVGTGIGAGIAGGGGGGGAAEDITYIQLPPAPPAAAAATDVALAQPPLPEVSIAPVIPPPMAMLPPPTVTISPTPMPAAGGSGG